MFSTCGHQLNCAGELSQTVSRPFKRVYSPACTRRHTRRGEDTHPQQRQITGKSNQRDRHTAKMDSGGPTQTNPYFIHRKEAAYFGWHQRADAQTRNRDSKSSPTSLSQPRVLGRRMIEEGKTKHQLDTQMTTRPDTRQITKNYFKLIQAIHHKSNIDQAITNKVPPGRPTVSDCGSSTYNASQNIDHYLGPLSTRHPSYIKDT